jgi:hypothetical protein
MRGVALAAVLGAAPGAMAQVEGQATWLWEVTTQDGDAIVEPGETATVTLSIDMTPDVNYPDGPVLGLGGALFDTLGGLNADKGSIVGWQVHEPFYGIGGDVTTTDGVSLFGTVVGQIVGVHPFYSPADPIGVLTFSWMPFDYSPFEIAYDTHTDLMMIWEGDLQDNEPPVEPKYDWDVVEADITFQVVPAPGGAVLIGLLPMLLRSRARS